MKTHPAPSPLTLINLSATALLLAIAHGRAACGDGSLAITNIPNLGGSDYRVEALSSAGQVTGYSFLTGDLEYHPFRFGNDGLADLGTLGGSFGQARALNQSGQVVGQAAIAGDTASHAFLYSGGTMFDLGTLGGSFSRATAINDAGQVVGDALTVDDLAIEAFLYDNGTMISLGTLGGDYSSATAINQSGSVAGDAITDQFEFHGFLYQNGAMSDLDSLGGGYSSALALNDQNVVVGESTLASGELRGFVYANGTMTDVGTLGGSSSSARKINNAGQVIGVSATTGDAQVNGFLYSNGTLTDLGTLGGGYSTPRAINNLGQVVGESANVNGEPRAFLWQNGLMTDLNALLPAASGWELHNAQFINDSGRIVGTGTWNGAPQWFVLDLGGANQSPVAVAGANQTADCGDTVTLDGTQSSDPDGDILTYQWSVGDLVLGSGATLTATFGSGSHAVTLTVTDPCGASSQDSIVVQVGDSTPPTVSCPGEISLSGHKKCNATVPDLRPLVTLSDNCTPASELIFTQSPAAGTQLGSGQYAVVVTVTDAAGNSATCSTTINVSDAVPPVIVCAPKPTFILVDRECSGKVPNLRRQLVARDNCTPANALVVTQSPAPGTPLPTGPHVVTLTVTDAAGNSTSKTVNVRVVDRTPPKIRSASASPSVLTPADGRVVRVTLNVAATDNCDNAPTVKIVKILCDERTSPGDFKIVGNLTALLRASHNARGNGRTYILIVECRDSSGNKAYRTVNVCVPKKSNGRGR